ncbi:hypothetical protein ACLKA6_017377 [Drosophila palustris]
MVTTIKITCDGVFIQSNSYLTPTQTNIATSAGKGVGSGSGSAADADAVATAVGNGNSLSNESDNSQTSSGSQTTGSSTTNTKKSNRSSCSRHQRGVASLGSQDTRRRYYYFGSKDVYWCKQSLTRSTSSLGHREATIAATSSSNSGQLISKARRRPLQLCSSLSAAYAPPKRKEFYFCDKYAAAGSGSGRGNTTSRIAASNTPTTSSAQPIDVRLLNFLRTAQRRFQSAATITAKPKSEYNNNNNNNISRSNTKERSSARSNNNNNNNNNNHNNFSSSSLPAIISTDDWFG